MNFEESNVLSVDVLVRLGLGVVLPFLDEL